MMKKFFGGLMGGPHGKGKFCKVKK